MSIYRQYDGYISGVGHELAEWLKDKTVINGISGQKMQDGYANGIGCLAAQYVVTFKDSIGNFYITYQDDKQEYNYEVRYSKGKFTIKVGSFKGSPDELLQY